MSQTILVIDDSPRTTARIAEALAPLNQKILTARDLDEAVNACSKVEPQLVIISTDLPDVKVGDAIVQLRARAGLKTTPFVALVSGVGGHEHAGDAEALGAQAVVAEPFDAEDLAGTVGRLVETPRAQTVISTDRGAEAMRGMAGAASGPTMTSEDIFGDLLEEAEREDALGAVRRDAPDVAESGIPPAAPETPKTRSVASRGSAEDALEATLADVLRTPDRPVRAREDKPRDSVDELLSKTLSGLEAGAARRPAPRPAPPAAPAPPPAVTPAAAPSPAARPRTEAKPAAPPEPVPEAAPTPVMEGEAFGQYELIDLIATGGMAELYKARMQGVEGFQKIVAIKRILPHLTSNDDFVTMFVDEAKLAAQLQHPNVIHIYDLGKIEQSYYIAMEYIDGKDLRSILRLLKDRGRRMPLALALHIGSRLAAALDYAHRKKDLHGNPMALVHRDVSPQNVLISFDGEIKLCDFGIAKAASKASHTRAGALKGKLQYMSPEQAWGKDLDGRSDIFSLGLVLYEAITGRAAFAGDSELSILEQVRSTQITPPREADPSIPEEVEKVLLKALQEHREERYQTAGELVEALEGLLQAIHPKPGSGDVGSFLAQLIAPAAPEPAAAAAAEPRPAAAVAATLPPPAAPLESSAVTTPAPKRPAVLWLGLAAVVVIAVGVWALAGRGRGGPAATPTPAPVLEAAVAQEPGAPLADAPAGVAAAVPPAVATPVQATAVPPTRVPPATPTPGAQAAAVVPSAIPTAAPTPVLPTAAPTEAVPTRIPTPRPAAAPTRAPVIATAAPTPAPPPPVSEGELVEIGPDVVRPQPVSTPTPEYPQLALRQRVGGVVELDVVVDENGNVQNVTVSRGVRSDIDAAAIRAARNWRFTPATKNGVRVKVPYTISMRFRP